MRLFQGAISVTVFLLLVGCAGKTGLMEVEPMDVEVARGFLGENRYEVLDVPDEENGFLVFEEAVKGLRSPSVGESEPPEDDLVPKQIGLEDVDDLVGIWAEVDRALAMRVWQPTESFFTFESLDYASYLAIKDLVRLGVLDARRSIEAGDRSAGVEKVLRVWKVADRYGERSPTLTHHLIVVACRAVASHGVKTLLEEGLLSAEEARQILEEAPANDALRTSLEMAMRGESTFFAIPFAAQKLVREIVAMVGSGGEAMSSEEVDVDKLELARLLSGVKDSIDREATVRAIADYYGKVIENVSEPGDEAILVTESRSRLSELLGSGKRLSGAEFDEARKIVQETENPLGELLLRFTAPLFSQSKNLLCRSMAAERLLMIELAGLAAGLTDLDSLGLDDELLVDPFTGERFRHDASTGWIWSVGDKRLGGDGEVVPNEDEVIGFRGAYLRAKL